MYGPTFKRTAPDYIALEAMPSVQRLKLDGLPPEEVAALVVAQFGPQVLFVGDRLLSVVEELGMGNPAAVVEVVRQLKAASPPVLGFATLTQQGEGGGGGNGDDSMQLDGSFGEIFRFVDLVEGVGVTDKRLTVPRPRLSKVLTEKLDKCTPKQKLLLKTASSVIAFFHRRFEESDNKDAAGGGGAGAGPGLRAGVGGDASGLNAFKLSYVEKCHPVEAHKAFLADDAQVGTPRPVAHRDQQQHHQEHRHLPAEQRG